MPIQHSVWRIGTPPRRLVEGRLQNEALLEDMITAAPGILSPEWMIIGRQEVTGHGGRIDLLAIAPDGALILIELKRGQTPREVVAQAIDYATWVERLDAQEIGAIYARFSGGGSLDAAFAARFGHPLDTETLAGSHQIVIVASALDASSERIVRYLSERDIPINVLYFQVFEADGGQILSRAWLYDPVGTQAAAAASAVADAKEPWNGEYYVSFGLDARDWEEARRFGFVSAGGGAWYTGTLGLLQPGDLIWAKVPGRGFVGCGRVRGGPVPAREFRLTGADGTEQPALDVLTGATCHAEFADDPERRECFVPVEWAQTRPLAEAVHEPGLFGNQNTVCAPKTPRWRQPVERLKTLFPEWNRVA